MPEPFTGHEDPHLRNHFRRLLINEDIVPEKDRETFRREAGAHGKDPREMGMLGIRPALPPSLKPYLVDAWELIRRGNGPQLTDFPQVKAGRLCSPEHDRLFFAFDGPRGDAAAEGE